MADRFTLEAHTWEIGDRLGKGGYGEVFEAKSDGRVAALKKVPKQPGAEREQLFQFPEAPNVVPIIDQGETETHWILVMPKARHSLREYLDNQDGPLDEKEALPILVDIAKALVALEDAKVVHRDLKPENVLLLNDKWSVADFGIARYAEAATGTNTYKYNGSPQYVPPERWNQKRATAQSDVYAFGIIAYEIVMGQLPFLGSEASDFREQHLTADAPEAQGVSSRFSALIDECLIKAPEARPTPTALLARLNKIVNYTSSQAKDLLHAVHRNEVRKQAEAAKSESIETSEHDRRSQLFEAAKRKMARIVKELSETVTEAAPSTTKTVTEDGTLRLALGAATLTCNATVYEAEKNNRSPFDIVGYSSVELKMRPPLSQHEGRSHSLWFCDAQTEGEYGWYETAFMSSPFSGSPSMEPYSLPPKQGIGPLRPTMGSTQVAWNFTRLEIDDMDDFIERWVGWFAAAAERKLYRPSNMPETPIKTTWRR